MNTFKKHSNKILFVLGLMITLTLLLPALIYDNLSYVGYEITFGKELIDINPFGLGSIASAHLGFSFLALLAYILPLVAGIIALASKKLALASLSLFVVSTFLFMSLPANIDITYIVAGSSNTAAVDWQMAHGLFAAIILSLVAVFVSINQLID
ncbi:hypothetical protein [Liberiplasma polymorphum]|uniref:hypothetical protein n=1 Tax=Liberiplasma polymorphum TaxID=3374570 RepID=UPI003771260B